MPGRFFLRRISQRMPWIEFALALCVLLAVAVASDSVTSRLAHAQDWVVHTHEVETMTAQTRADVVAAGDARQIFIITSDKTALADYDRAKAAIPGEIAKLQQMTSDNPTQQANVRELRQVVVERMDLLEKSIALHEASGADTEQQKQWTRDSVALKNHALAILDRMKAEDDRLMAVRQTISAETYRHVRIVLIASFAVVVLLLMINFYDLSRELKERRQAEQAVQQLSSRILRVQDEERRRVARELHDSIGQVFAVLKMNLEMISRTIGKSDPQQIQQLLAESKTALEIGLSGARTLSHLLHPPLLDEMGFASAAKWLAEGFSQRSSIKVKLELSENLPRMEQDVELTLFRILQEALTNIHKHSGSPSVDINVEIDGVNAFLRIRDYGRGIPAAVIENFKRSKAGLGVGLAGMRERVRDLGGHLDLKSDGTGAVVEARVPFVPAAPTEEQGAVFSDAFTPEHHG